MEAGRFSQEFRRMKRRKIPAEEAVKKVVIKNSFARPRWSGDIEIKLWKSLLHRALYQAHPELGIYVSRASLLLLGSFLTASKASDPVICGNLRNLWL